MSIVLKSENFQLGIDEWNHFIKHYLKLIIQWVDSLVRDFIKKQIFTLFHDIVTEHCNEQQVIIRKIKSTLMINYSYEYSVLKTI